MPNPSRFFDPALLRAPYLEFEKGLIGNATDCRRDSDKNWELDISSFISQDTAQLYHALACGKGVSELEKNHLVAKMLNV